MVVGLHNRFAGQDQALKILRLVVQTYHGLTNWILPVFGGVGEVARLPGNYQQDDSGK
jgi:hypothetical protein